MKSIGAIMVGKFHQQIDDLLPQNGKIALNNVLQDLRVNQVVGVGKNCSCADDSSPCNLRVGHPILISELPGRFANDFKIATHRIKDHWFVRPITSKACRIGQSFVNTILDRDEIKPMVFNRKSERPGFSKHSITDVRVKATDFDKIYWRIEQIPQIRKQPAEIEYIAASFEVNQKIDIAIRPGLASRNRAKDTNIRCTMNTGQFEDRRPLFGLESLKSHGLLSLLCNGQEGIAQ